MLKLGLGRVRLSDDYKYHGALPQGAMTAITTALPYTCYASVWSIQADGYLPLVLADWKCLLYFTCNLSISVLVLSLSYVRVFPAIMPKCRLP